MKKGKQETYVKDDTELRELLVVEILDDAQLVLNKKESLLEESAWKIYISTREGSVISQWPDSQLPDRVARKHKTRGERGGLEKDKEVKKW